MKARLLKRTQAAPSANDERLVVVDGVTYWPEGSIIEDPRAYRLVQMGVAEPADSECVFAAGMSTERMALAQQQQELVANGIHPDDYQRYLDGEITGYDENGKDIPGPNYKEETEDDDTES
jgi:hypothetical protein